MFADPHARPRHCLAPALWWLVAISAVSAADDPRAVLDQAYARTKSAGSVDEFNAILRLCETQDPDRLPTDLAAYRKQLLGWTYNRRGELYAQQAGELTGAADRPRAQQLEALALADFQLAIQNDPQRWKAFHNRAVSFALTGKFPEAIADLQRVLVLKPDHVDAMFNLGEIRRELGQLEEALADYSRAIERQPNDGAAYCGRGRVHESLERFPEAIRDFRRAVECNPKDAVALACRAGMLQRQGRWDEAALDLREAGRLNPNSGEVLQRVAWLMATCPDSRFRQNELAVQTAERALELSENDDARYLDTLAAAYANAGRFDDAARLAQSAIDCAGPSRNRTEIEQRLTLYRQQKPYRQSASEAPRSKVPVR